MMKNTMSLPTAYKITPAGWTLGLTSVFLAIVQILNWTGFCYHSMTMTACVSFFKLGYNNAMKTFTSWEEILN
jgi:hypothetical protein